MVADNNATKDNGNQNFSPSGEPFGGNPSAELFGGHHRYDYQTADPMMYGLLKAFAAKHKAYPTEAETLIWNYLKANQLGVRYRPQHIIGCFIADFACVSLKLIIEIDGLYHIFLSSKSAMSNAPCGSNSVDGRLSASPMMTSSII